jgi:hypothetical protein
MWVFAKRGFVSIVQDADPRFFVVRGRVKGDIENLFPGIKSELTTGHDYRYRARLPWFMVQAGISKTVEEITYDNYKASVADHRRLEYYGMIWAICADMQDALAGNGKSFNGH